MKALLEKAPHNVDKSEEYDALIAEFNGILEGRNDYAHGLWYTHTDSGMVLLAKKDEHGFVFFDPKKSPSKILRTFSTGFENSTSRLPASTRRPGSKPKPVPHDAAVEDVPGLKQ